MGPARYRDLNSDIPSCISKFHIQDGHEPNGASAQPHSGSSRAHDEMSHHNTTVVQNNMQTTVVRVESTKMCYFDLICFCLRKCESGAISWI